MISFHKYTHKAAYMQITHVEMSSQQYYNPDTDTFPITEDIFYLPRQRSIRIPLLQTAPSAMLCLRQSQRENTHRNHHHITP